MGGAVRGCALALLSALLTATGHVLGGGSLPDLTLLVVLLPLLCGVLVTVADRATGLPALLGTLAAGQLALHHLLALLHPAHTGLRTMWVMHATATFVLAVAVRHADTAVDSVLAAVRRVLPRRVTPPPARRPLTAPVPAAPATGLRLAGALAAADARRGPPEGCRPHPHLTSRRPTCPTLPACSH